MELNQFKFKLLYDELKQKYNGKNYLNKSQTLLEIERSSSTASRRAMSNVKYDIPLPTYSNEYKRSGKPYFTYQYSLYDIAIFKTDRNYYWHMLNERKNDV